MRRPGILYKMGLAAILWLVLGLIIAQKWRNFGTFLFYGPVWEDADFFQLVDEVISEGTPPASVDYSRRKLGKKEGEYVTVYGIRHPDDNTFQRPIRFEEGDRVAVGLSRLRDGYSSAWWEYTFSVYEIMNGKRRKLVETEGPVSLLPNTLFEVGDKLRERGYGKRELEYVIKPRGFRARAGSIVARILGAAPYYKDFIFLTPGIMHQRRPDELNVILISFDTLRPDRLGCYGYSRRPTSPHIDSFAKQSAIFTEAFSSSPWTIPAHFSLMTGLYPSAQMSSPDKIRLSRSYADRPLATILRENGYYTVGFTGGLHVTSARGFALGFDQFTEFHYENVDSTSRIFQTATQWLEENNGSKFFMFLHNYECHSPYRIDHFLVKEAPRSLIEKRKARYDGGVRSADAYFSELIEKLRSLNLLSKTLIVALSDHGEDLHDHFTERDMVPLQQSPVPVRSDKIDHGHSLYDEVIRILLLFHLPGFEPGNKVITNQVSLIDVMPTILDYLDIEVDGPIQGKSLLGLMREGTRAEDPPAISEFTLSGPERKSVRLNGYKYIYIPDPAQRKDNITYKDIPQYALFDLSRDPKEKNNIYSNNMELARHYHHILQDALEESDAIKSELQARNPSSDEEAVELPQDVIDALRAVGYLD